MSMQDNISKIAQLLEHTLNPDPSQRKSAEDQLSGAQKALGFAIVMMELIKNQNIHPQIRLSGAIILKNFVRSNWESKDDIKESDREYIKQNALRLMLETTGTIQHQISEMISIICEYDFYEKWPTLLPELVNRLKTNDFNTIRSLLSTCHSIFRKYRDESKTDEVENELIYIMKTFASPMLDIFKSFFQTLSSPAAQQEQFTKMVFECINYLLEIFYSLNWVDLPEFFEDHIQEYFTIFHDIMNYSNVHVETDPDDTDPGLLDISKTLITEIATLYLEKYDEEFEGQVQRFTVTIWNLLCKTTLSLKYDKFVSKALAYLTSASKSMQHSFFNSDEMLIKICEEVIIPNVTLREEDIELFEDDPVDYIRRDIEGSDSDTRRRAASELVKGLSVHYEAKVTQILINKISQLLSQASQNWKALDVAIYLVISISIKGQTRMKGATQINPLVPINDFLNTQILQQLSNQDVNALPVVKADSLKFLCLFRQHLPKEQFQRFFPLVINMLKAEQRVVHTYAAWCIERILSVKDTYVDGNVEKSRSRYSKEDVQPYAEQLLVNLFGALQFASSSENEYVMKAIMRVTAVLKDTMEKYMATYIDSITSILKRVCANPKNPLFNHYIFESYATVIKFNPRFVDAFEGSLFPTLLGILEKDIQEFTPYVFQIMSQLLELRPAPIPQGYLKLLPSILNYTLWKNEGNIPGLVGMLTGFLAKDNTEIIKPNNLETVLLIFQKLVNLKAQDHNGFIILDAVILNVPMNLISGNLSKIFVILFSRLKDKKTVKFIRCLIIFFSLFIIKHGAASFLQVIEGVQKGLFVQILQVWLTNLHKVTGKMERKTCSVALTNLMLEPLFLRIPEASELFGMALKENVKYLELVTEETQMDEAIDETAPTVVQDETGTGHGYKVAYAKLSFASKSSADPAAHVPDAKVYLAQSLHAKLTSSDGPTKQFIMQSINGQGLSQQISEYMNRAKLSL